MSTHTNPHAAPEGGSPPRNSITEAIDAAYDEVIAGAPFTIEHGPVLELSDAHFGLFGRYAIQLLDSETLSPATDHDGHVVAKIRADDFALSELLYGVRNATTPSLSYKFIPSETVLTESLDDGV